MALKQTNAPEEKKGAVFLDRDGTLNPDSGYIDSIERFELFPGAAAAIARLNRRGIPVMLVTNQSGIVRGFFSEAFLSRLHQHLQQLLAKEGARLDGIYYCPHHPDWEKCNCRKPAPGMVEKAVLEHHLDFSRSYVVGDKCSDMGLVQGGAKGILVQTGDGVASLKKLIQSGKCPDHVSADLAEAVEWILQQNGGR